MEQFRNKRKERFCQIIALEDCDVADAAYRAGYGDTTHPNKDNYHYQQGYKLINREDVQLRINTIRQQINSNNKETRRTVLQFLIDVINADYTKYYKSTNVVLTNGRTVTDVYLSTPIQDWDERDKKLVTGFDGRGMPVRFDKNATIDKIMRIMGNFATDDEDDKEDIRGLFAGAGLAFGEEFIDTGDLEDEESGDDEE